MYTPIEGDEQAISTYNDENGLRLHLKGREEGEERRKVRWIGT